MGGTLMKELLMKKEHITSVINTYDEKKGWGRSARDEPHIAELRPFVVKITGSDLLPAELVQLADIVRGKNDREADTASSRAFSQLAEPLGGYAALDLLKEHKILQETNIVFLEKYPGLGYGLASFIAQVSKKIPEKLVQALLNALEFREVLGTLPELVTLYKESFLLKNINIADHLPLLTLLNTHQLYTDNLKPLLIRFSESSNFQLMELTRTLNKLAALNPELITLSNVEALLGSPSLPQVDQFMQLVPPVQANLDTILTHFPLRPSAWLPKLLANFRSASWDVTPFLKDIVASEEHLFELATAVATLGGAALDIGDLASVLTILLNHRIFSPSLAKAVRLSLSNQAILLDDLELISRFPDHAENVVLARIHLKTYGLLPEAAFITACIHSQFASGVSQFLIQWHKIYGADKEPHEAVLGNPQRAGESAQVLAFLHGEELASEANVSAVCQADLKDGFLLLFLQSLKKAEQLTQGNIDLLLPRIDSINLLYPAVQCLENGGVLEQINYESLLVDPENAMTLALELGGKVIEPSKADAEKEAASVNEQAFERVDQQPEAIETSLPAKSPTRPYQGIFFSHPFVTPVVTTVDDSNDDSNDDSLFPSQ